MALTTAQIQQAYVTFFSRPADPAGLNYWSSYAGSVADLYATFAKSTEYSAAFTGLSSAQQVNVVYQNLFGRDAEATGLLYWAKQIDDGKITVANLALAVSAGAQTTDAAVVTNRVTAATSFTAALDTAAEILGYTGANANAVAKTWLATVKDTAASLTTATAGVDSTIASTVAVGGAAGSNFTLATGVDIVSGTGGNDTIYGTDASFTTGDVLTGGAGTDTLSLTLSAANTAAVTSTGVEVVKAANFHTAANTVSLASFSGVTEVQNVGSTEAVTFSNVSGETATVTLAGLGVAKNTAVTYKDTATLGTTDALAVNAQGVTAAVTLTAQTTTANTGGVETFNVSSTVANNTGVLTLAGALQTGVTAQTVNVTGDKNLKLAVSDKMTTVNASTFTGNLTADLTATANYTATGGSGNDRFDFGSAFTSSDKVNGGAGTDRIAFSGGTYSDLATALNTKSAALVPNVSNVEVLEYTGTGAYAIDNSLVTVAGLTTYATSGAVVGAAIGSGASTAGTVALAFTNEVNANAFIFEGNVTGGAGGFLSSAVGGAGAKALTFAPLVDNGSNAVNITLKGVAITGGAGGGGSTTAGAGGSAADFSNFETVNITSAKADSGTATNSFVAGVGGVTGSAGVGGGTTQANVIIASANTTFNIDGSNDINLGLLYSNNTALNVNAGNLTGKLTVATGSGADSIIGGSNVNTITLNGGVDALDLTKSTAKADVITQASAAGQTGSLITTIAGFTNVATNGDKLDIINTATIRADVAAGASTGVTNLTGSVTNGVVTFAGSAAATATLAEKISAVYSTNILGTTQYNTVVFEHNGNTYVAEQNDTTATYLAGTDLIIQLTGVTGVTALSTTASAAATVYIA